MTVFGDLLNGHDYLLLLGKALLPYRRKETEPEIDGLSSFQDLGGRH